MKPPHRSEAVAPQAVEGYEIRPFAVCLFIVFATLVVYWQVQNHTFLNYDDTEYVTGNLVVKMGLTLEGVTWVFSESFASNWHPVTLLSHMLDVEIYGMNPSGHHLTNLFLHIANSLLLFGVLLKMTGALWRSGLVAALFALHPFNVESVAWIAERKNVLSAFFWFLTLWAYIDYVKNRKIGNYMLVILFFALGLMSKPMLITLPFVLLLLDFWPLGRCRLGLNKQANEGSEKIEKNPQLIREKIPFFVIAGAFSAGIYSLAKEGGALTAMEGYSLSLRLSNAAVSYMTYLQKTFWPTNFSVFYPHPGNNIPVWQIFLCLTLLVMISFWVIRLRRVAPYLVFGWLWFLGTLVPVIQIVQGGAHAMADRYAYISLIGIFIMVAWGVFDLLDRWRQKKKTAFIFSALLIPLMVVTWMQVSHWKNSVTLFEHAIQVTDTKYPSFAIVHNNLGHALIVDGKNEEAISQYKKAIQFEPGFVKAHYNLGHALISERKSEEAIAQYKIAVQLKPDYVQAHYNLAHALFEHGKTKEAISQYERVIELRPNLASAHNNLGLALLKDEKKEDAISHFMMAVKVKPNYALAQKNLRAALFSSEKEDLEPSP